MTDMIDAAGVTDVTNVTNVTLRLTVSRFARIACAALALALASGCATVGGDPRDPFEAFNRAMFGFNEGFDESFGKPIASAYKEALPDPVRTGVRNFFANLGDIFIGVNNLLQGKPGESISDWTRFVVNTTVGIIGVFDVASEMGLEKHNEDFGQTFGRWGADSGAYLVWPMLGSSSVRDSLGGVFDYYFDPLWRHIPVRARNSLVVLQATNQRADLLDASRILEEAALDKYVFQRDAYLQRRRNLIHDGNPPREVPDTSRRESPAARAPSREDPGLRHAMQPAPQRHAVVNATLPSGVGVSYEPRTPRNYEAVMSALHGEIHAFNTK